MRPSFLAENVLKVLLVTEQSQHFVLYLLYYVNVIQYIIVPYIRSEIRS